MKKIISFLALAVCVFVTLFLCGLIAYSLIFRDGILILDFNYYQEGWYEFGFFFIMGIIGFAGIGYLFRDWLREGSILMFRNRLTVVIILCILSFALVTAILILALTLFRS